MSLLQIIIILIVVQLVVILVVKLFGRKITDAATIPLEWATQRIDRSCVGKAGAEWDLQVKEMLERSSSDLKDSYETTLEKFGVRRTTTVVPPSLEKLPGSLKKFFMRFEKLRFADGYTPVDVQVLSEREDSDSQKVIVFGVDPENESDQYAVLKNDDAIYILSEDGELERFVPSFEHLVVFHAKLMEHTRILLQGKSPNPAQPPPSPSK